MTESDVWPVVFVGWRSKADEFLGAIAKGQLDVWTGKLHIRKGAAFLAILEDGTLIARGHVVNVSGTIHEISLANSAADASTAPVLGPGLIEKVRAIPKPFLKGPVNAFIIPPDKKDGVFDLQWFEAAASFAEHALSGTAGSAKAATITPEPKGLVAAGKDDAATPETPVEDEREALLKGWIPPVLQGLLAERVRADQWELLVAYAFRALGCKVTYLGKTKTAKPVPDCIARYTSPAGQAIELIIDAKAGQWNGALDDIRAMRDYVELATPYASPLFVANSLVKDVSDKLKQHIMHGKVARAICGRDLALLIEKRLTDPDFNVEFELRRFFL